MKVRFQADADLRRPIIAGLRRREPTIDFRTAHEAGLAGLNDATVLAIAADDGRLLVSHDVSTMPEHFARFIQTPSPKRLLGNAKRSCAKRKRKNARALLSPDVGDQLSNGRVY